MRVMDATGLGRPGITRHGLFADIRGDDGAPPLLFLHGGPGQGCHDFMALQGDRLARSVRVVGLDQRGVDRSAQLPETGENPAVTIADLIADCEAARRALGIERWAVLGHSFGGNLALRYAVACPDAIEAVIFENPVWDMALSCRAALPHIAALLAAPGRDKQAEARTARESASRETAPRSLRAAYLAALEALGEDRENFFVPSAGTRERMRRLRQARPATGEAERQAIEASTLRHHVAISSSDAFFEPVLPLQAKLRCPALLITGALDPITSAEQREAFGASSPARRSARFPRAGHFVHADEPDAYAGAVTSFLRGDRVTATASGEAPPSGW
jgi:proline iminopeptidase